MADLSEIFSVIFEQETTIYKCDDYLSTGFHTRKRGRHFEDSGERTSINIDVSLKQPLNSSASSSVDESLREIICVWSFQVVDHFDFRRETAAISLSYLDRFVLASRPDNRRTFQLAAMTTLYLAIKLFEPRQLKVNDLVKLSKGCFVAENIVMMEESILRALSWHVHPPTSLSVINQIIPIMIYLGYDKKAIFEVIEYSRFLTELGVCDYYFVIRKPSSIGLAAVLVAIEQLDAQTFPKTTSHRLLEELRGIYPQEMERIKEIKECKNRLLGLYIAGGYDQQKKEMKRGRSPDGVIDTTDNGRTRQQDASSIDSSDIPDKSTHILFFTRQHDAGVNTDPTPSETTGADEGSTDSVRAVAKILKKGRSLDRKDSTDCISTIHLEGDAMQQDIHTDKAASIEVDPCESAGSLNHQLQNVECVDVTDNTNTVSNATLKLFHKSRCKTPGPVNLKYCEAMACTQIETSGDAEFHQHISVHGSAIVSGALPKRAKNRHEYMIQGYDSRVYHILGVETNNQLLA